MNDESSVVPPDPSKVSTHLDPAGPPGEPGADAPPAAFDKPGVMFIRPSNQGKHAFYAPERDVALQGTRIMGEVEKMILENRHEPWMGAYEALRAYHGSTLPVAEELRAAGMACVEYVADCWGKVYEPGRGLADWPQAPRRLDVEEAVAKLRSKAPPAALEFILMLQGYYLMDFYFAGLGQAMQVGLELDRSSQEIYSIFDTMTRHLWTGEPAEKQLIGELRKVAAAALHAGIRSSTLQAAIDAEAAKI